MQSQSPDLVYYYQGDLKNEFYSHDDEPILKFVSFKAECQKLILKIFNSSSMVIGSLTSPCSASQEERSVE